MAEVYYIQNEKQYRTIVSRLSVESGEIDSVTEYGIVGCKYVDESVIDECYSCDLEECILYNHLSDRDKKALNNMEINISSTDEFPMILLVQDNCISGEKFILVSVSDAKDNTKYGIGTGW